MRLDPFHVLVPLIVAVSAILLLALDTSAVSSCDGAQKHFDHGQVEQAQTELKAILKAEPGSRCAAGLVAKAESSITEGACNNADAALKAKLLARALKGYQELLAMDAANSCGVKGVAAVAEEMCARAAVLARHRAGEAAHDAYAAILKIEPLDPIEPCPAEGLVSVPTGPGEPKTIVIRGVDGKEGTDGTDGTDGIDGTDGTDGTDGKDGTGGTDGADGAPGRRGTPGKPGKPGKDGTPGKDGKVIVLNGKG